MKTFKITLLLTFAILMMSHDTMAQITPSNFLGINPPGTFFNPAGKFTAIGESGGQPGFINGCDIYGFRSQYSLSDNIGMGMQISVLQPFPPGPTPYTIPTILWSTRSGARLVFQQENGNASSFGCGQNVMALGASNFNSYVMYVYGDAFASGGVWQNSDLNLKENVRNIPNALDVIEQLEGVTYNYRKDVAPEKNLNDRQAFGFIAQEVEKILPSIVQTDDEGYLSMKYDAIIPIMTEAIKVQQEFIRDQDLIIEEQTNKIDNLEARLAKIERMLNASQSRTETTMSTISSGATLKQNRPNPFSKTTTIEYTLPESVKNATLNIYDMYGKVINSFNVNANSGTIEVDARNMSNGTYIYSMEADGKSLAKEKMVVLK